MTMLVEDRYPDISIAGGLNTNKPVAFGSTLAVTGVVTLGGIVNTGTTSGSRSNIISGSGATATLTAAQSGSTALFDRAAGIVYTLPPPVTGYVFNFVATVSVTTNSYKVITDAGTTLLQGQVFSIDTDSTNAVAAWTGNGSSHLAVTQAAAATNATGGLLGSWLRFTCVSTTLWQVEGMTQAAGTPSTPFATS